MSAERLSDNLMQPFQLESSALRGRVIRLGDTVDRVLTRHATPSRCPACSASFWS